MTKEPKTDRDKGRVVRVRQRAIGRELRRMYDDVAREPIPDEFLDLLQKIDDSGKGGGKA
ncbi:MAG TPA: NepR family anti-sigma factor [Rhizomicrobium sp.]|nr:NepR family anti-sigma factor [Rhizomicrobium sp.]HEX4533107.1 NepR family anti-sigma factor [Rhizomicrobium sp.]